MIGLVRAFHRHVEVGGLLGGQNSQFHPDLREVQAGTFNSNSDNDIYAVAIQPDGKVLAGGAYGVGGSGRVYFSRLNANGTLDSVFNPNANGSNVNGAVHGVAVQADGKIIIGGEFSAGFTRLNANSTPDNSFVPANTNISTFAVQADGKILTGGNGLSRRNNDPATQSLTVPSVNRVQWLRGGASPEVGQVSFELSTDGGNTYNALGVGTRIAGGWEKTGLTLPGSGEIRARGRTASGNGSGVVETLAAFGTAAPDIAVEQPLGTDIADGGIANFGDVAVGDTLTRTFTIKNTGTATLAGLSITKDGADAAMMTITASASPIPPLPGGGSTTFTVRFAPTSTGGTTAALHIASNDPDENPFDVTLTGIGTLSSNADLAGLSLSAGTLTPAFAGGTTSYGASVAYAISSVTATPTVAQSTATVRVNGVTVASGSPSAPLSLSFGANALAVVVTAGDGVTPRTYNITVTRAAPAPGDVQTDLTPNPNGSVLPVAVQPDGKIVIGGNFATVGGLARSRLARLLANGTVESTATFNPGTGANGEVSVVGVQADGKILLGGSFTTVNGQTRNRLARLNTDGTLESTATFNAGTGPSAAVYGVAFQTDGKILLAGAFTAVNGQTRNRIARLDASGAVEGTATFDPGTGANNTVYSAALQADGKILLGGIFTTVNAQTRNRIVRLNTDGTLESTATFNPGTGANGEISAVCVQADGKILLGGAFTSVNGQARNRIARLNADGTLESTATFNAGTGANDKVLTVGLQADGKILLGGLFTTVNAQTRNRIARLNPDGSIESTATFNAGAGANGVVNGVAVQADGKIVLGGSFSSVNGQPRSNLALLFNDAATQSFALPDSTRVQWARSGTVPEVEQVTFELSLDAGASWSPLGSGTRIAGGWERTGLSLPASGSIRVRGRTVGGMSNASTGSIEQLVLFNTATPLQLWKLLHLGDAAAPDDGDPDGDGFLTLAEYGLNLLPEAPSVAPGVTLFSYAEGGRLRIFLQRDPAHDDVTIEVQASGSPGGPWTPVATSVLGAPFSGAGYVSGDSATPGVKTIEVRDIVNIADAPARFLRVRVSH